MSQILPTFQSIMPLTIRPLCLSERQSTFWTAFRCRFYLSVWNCLPSSLLVLFLFLLIHLHLSPFHYPTLPPWIWNKVCHLSQILNKNIKLITQFYQAILSFQKYQLMDRYTWIKCFSYKALVIKFASSSFHPYMKNSKISLLSQEDNPWEVFIQGN